jgi:hypothetical protein
VGNREQEGHVEEGLWVEDGKPREGDQGESTIASVK